MASKTETVSDFRTELKNTRQLFNISQTDFATSLGISQKHLNRIENCHQYPSFPLLYEMCSKLGYRLKLEFDLVNSQSPAMTNHKSSFPKVKTEKKPKTYSTMEPISQDEEGCPTCHNNRYACTNSWHKDHPEIASGSVADPKEELWEKLSSLRDKYFLEEFHPSYWKAKEGFENESQTIGDALDAIDELASLRQQLKEREEALKELLPIAAKELSNEKQRGNIFLGGTNYEKYKAIIEKARNLILNKQS